LGSSALHALRKLGCTHLPYFAVIARAAGRRRMAGTLSRRILFAKKIARGGEPSH
jgi:hypothetical protein